MISDCQDQLDWLCTKVFGNKVDSPTNSNITIAHDPDTVATTERVEACREALEQLDDAVEGNNGSGRTINAVSEIRRHRIYGEQGYELLQEFNENKCFPSWEDHDLRRKWNEGPKFEPAVVDEFGKIDKRDEVTGRLPSQLQEVTFRRITSQELDTGDYTLDFAIRDTMVEGQPLIIAGPQKVLKTSMMIDAVISLAIGGYFFGKLKVKRPYRVAVMSGESGLATLQETAQRICKAAKVNLSAMDNLIWSPDLPKFGNGRHITALEKFLQADAIEVLIVDPAYLCMSGADAGNLFIQGEMLREVSLVCERLGVTLVLLHHTKKVNDRSGKNQPLSLTDIAWSGFQEFARQWWLINRREPYVEGSGEHQLWLSIGGSAGHSALWGVDVNEGIRSEFKERHWDVNLFTPGEAQGNDRERRKDTHLPVDRETVLDTLKAAGEPLTKSRIKDLGIGNTQRNERAIASLVESGEVIHADAVLGNGQTRDGFTLVEENSSD